MLNFLKHRAVYLNLLFLLLASFLFLSSPLNAATYYVAKEGNNINDGRLVSAGGTGPWLTIQYASGLLKAGDTLYVRAGTYNEPYPSNGSSKSNGIRPKFAGKSGSPITYAADVNEHVIIDPNYASPCFYVDKSYTVIRGFDMTRCNIAGVWVSGADYVTIEDNHIHNVNGKTGSNPAGIRLDTTGWSVVRNNLIHHVYHGGQLNLFNHSNNGGVLSFYGHNITVEYNEIHDMAHAIYHKMADISSRKGWVIRNNKLHNVYSAMRWASQGASDGTTRKHHDAEVYENVIYNAVLGIDLWVINDLTTHENISIYNNTFINVQNHLFGWNNVQLWSNIFYNNLANVSNSSLNANASISMEVTNKILNSASQHQGSLGYSNYNLLYPKFKIVLGQNGGPDGLREAFVDLSAWRLASSSSYNLLFSNPDQLSLAVDPLFQNISTNSYSLKASSPALGKGRYGENIGAYASDTVQVGPSFDASIGWVGKRAKPPNNFQVAQN